MNNNKMLIYFLISTLQFFIRTTDTFCQTLPITIDIQNGTIPNEKINSMGATESQVLKYSNGFWGPSDIDQLTYVGTWDAETNDPDLTGGGNVGDFYIVDTAGEGIIPGGIGTESWSIGDWVIWNESEDRWEKLSNSSNVRSFNGRVDEIVPLANDYTWEQIDKSNSSLSDLTDVDTTGISYNDILKWDGATWVPYVDNDDGITSLTANRPLTSTGGPTPDLGMYRGNSSTDGYLTKGDWNLFNNKQNGILSGTSSQYLKGDLTLGVLSADTLSTVISTFAPLAGVVTNTDTIITAINKLDGNIATRIPAIPKGNLYESNSNILTITNGSNAVHGLGTSIEIIQADANTDGYLSNSDWSIFNAKMNETDVDNITIEVDGSSLLNIMNDSITSDKLSTGLETKNSDYTVTTADNNKVLLVTGNSTITLPSVTAIDVGFSITIKNIDESNAVTIITNANETIDGKEVSVLETQYSYETLISNGTNWYITAQNGTIGWCPIGFIPVEENSELSVSNFCVMKYEAKDVGGVPTSIAAGTPWVNINATTAQTNCETLAVTGFDGEFTLISNPEWMTIARSIEKVPSNWSSRNIGTGDLARGWSASTVNDGFQNTGVAPSTSYSCLYNTASDTCSSYGTHKLRRTHYLTNGREIWDFSGNVASWTDWDSAVGGYSDGPTDTNLGWKELTTLEGATLTASDLQSGLGYTSTSQVGMWYGGTGGAAYRGGMWSDGTSGGVFNLVLSNNSTYSSSSLGFRCVYRP